MSASPKKVFVLDTNVLLHDPNAIFHFQEHDLVIPIAVIEEVDHFKKDQTEVGRNARTVSRHLDRLRERGTLSQGVVLDAGGVLKIDVDPHNLELGLSTSDKHLADNIILSCALELLKNRKEKVVMVSKDSNLRIKADAIGLIAEDYTTDMVEWDEMYRGWTDIHTNAEAIDELFEGGLLPEEDWRLHSNQFVTLIDQADENHTAIGRVHASDGLIHPLKRDVTSPWGIKPRNREQQFAMDLLLDDSIMVVTLHGKAGTGKTLLALAAGLHKVVDEEKYNKLLVSRPVMPMGKDIGFLPGDVEHKLRPYMQPIYDNLDLCVQANMDARRRTGMTSAQLEEAGYLSVEPLTYIRGRSIPSQFLIVDEAQNLTPHEVKTILTRAGEGTKVILTGDPEQIDNPYVDSATNGLSFLAEHFKSQEIAGHVTLVKGERSRLAELASKLL